MLEFHKNESIIYIYIYIYIRFFTLFTDSNDKF